MIHRNIVIEGCVQGVGFRWATRTWANRLGVAGFVRNEADGSVYIEAEADEAAMDQFLEWCQHGPSGADVERVTPTAGPFRGFRGFEIRGA